MTYVKGQRGNLSGRPKKSVLQEVAATISKSTVDPIHYAWECCNRGTSLPSALWMKNASGSPLASSLANAGRFPTAGAPLTRGGCCPGGDSFTPRIRATTHAGQEDRAALSFLRPMLGCSRN